MNLCGGDIRMSGPIYLIDCVQIKNNFKIYFLTKNSKFGMFIEDLGVSRLYSKIVEWNIFLKCWIRRIIMHIWIKKFSNIFIKSLFVKIEYYLALKQIERIQQSTYPFLFPNTSRIILSNLFAIKALPYWFRFRK